VACALLAVSPARAYEPEYGARSVKDKYEILVGPDLWSRPDIDSRFAIKVLLDGIREVGYLAIVPPKVELRPILSPRVQPLSRIAGAAGAAAAINGGFFNRSDGVPASYLVANGHLLADPRDNAALTGNPALRPHLKEILDRPEWRVWTTPAGRRVAFEPHHIAPAPGWKLVHALQAGPLLLPYLGLHEGAFVRGQDDPIRSKARTGRSAIGLRNDGCTLLLALPMPPSRGLSILELQALLAKVGAIEAMALDGGESSGFVIRPNDPKALWWGHDSHVRTALGLILPAPKVKEKSKKSGH